MNELLSSWPFIESAYNSGEVATAESIARISLRAPEIRSGFTPADRSIARDSLEGAWKIMVQGVRTSPVIAFAAGLTVVACCRVRYGESNEEILDRRRVALAALTSCQAIVSSGLFDPGIATIEEDIEAELRALQEGPASGIEAFGIIGKARTLRELGAHQLAKSVLRRGIARLVEGELRDIDAGMLCQAYTAFAEICLDSPDREPQDYDEGVTHAALAVQALDKAANDSDLDRLNRANALCLLGKCETQRQIALLGEGTSEPDAAKLRDAHRKIALAVDIIESLERVKGGLASSEELANALDGLASVEELLALAEGSRALIAKAETAYRRAIELTKSPAMLFRLNYSLGRLLQRDGRAGEAIGPLEDSRAYLMGVIDFEPNASVKAYLGSTFQSVFSDLTTAYIDLGEPERALLVSESGKARALGAYYSLLAAFRDAAEALAPDARRYIVEHFVDSDRLRRWDMSSGLDESVLRLKFALSKASSHIGEYSSALRPSSSRNARCVADYCDLARSIRACMVEFRVEPDNGYALIVTPDRGVLSVRLPESNGRFWFELLHQPGTGWLQAMRLSKWLKGALEVVTAKQEAETGYMEVVHEAYVAWARARLQEQEILRCALNQVYIRVFAPLRSTLRKTERLVLIPNSLMGGFPLHACWWREGDTLRYLIDDFVISYAPSLEILLLANKPGSPLKPPRSGLVLKPNNPDLNAAAWECDQIANTIGPQWCVTIPSDKVRALSPATAMSAAENRELIHLASHAQYIQRDPLSSFVLLNRDQGEESVLTIADLLGRAALRGARLVSISACESSVVESLDRGDEFLGIATAFVLAGSSAAWGSLFEVDDKATALLMARAYEYLMGSRFDPARALCEAQRWLKSVTNRELTNWLDSKGTTEKLKEVFTRHGALEGGAPDDRPYSHPVLWAGFQCLGG